MPIAILNRLTGKKYIKLAERGNKAIYESLRLASSLNRSRLLIQEQGGWLTYRQFGEELGFDVVELKTDYGLTDLADLKQKANPQSVVLINSLPGYHALENMFKIFDICRENGALLINDVSGSVGTDEAKLGNLIIGSFGKGKPVNLQYGGFIATDNKSFYDAAECYFDDERLEDLKLKLEKLHGRLEMYQQVNRKIKRDLKEFSIIHPVGYGINVIVKFTADDEKQKIIKYCGENKFEYTLCPRYIRVNTDAVSIEVKRLY